MIKISGKLLIFDKEDRCGHIFPKTCKIDIPENPPIGIAGNIESFIGTATVERRDDCLFVSGKIIGPEEEIIKNIPLYFGGYYKCIRDHKNDGSLEIIASMKLHHIGLYTEDEAADLDLRVKLEDSDE